MKQIKRLAYKHLLAGTLHHLVVSQQNHSVSRAQKKYLLNREILLELKTKNELLNNLEILIGKPYLSSIPSHLEIEFTNACNLRCYMCYQSNHKVNYAQVSDNTLSHVIGMLPYVKTILIAGLGEQLLYQRLGIFLETAADYLCEVSMFTNGHLVHRHLDIFKHLSLLTVSFDGATPEVFETQRHGANFERVLRNIELLRAKYPKLQIRLSCVVSKLNVNQIEDIVKIGCDTGANIVCFSHVQHAPAIELTKKDYPVIKKQLNNAIKFAGDHNIVIQHNDIENIKKVNNSSEIEAGRLLANVKKESEGREIQTPKDIAGLRRILSYQHNINKLEFPTVEELRKANNFLDIKIKKIKRLIREKRIKQISKPHCLSVWNYAFVRMSGNFRLCPYCALEAGNINSDDISKGLNDRLLIKVRTSLFERKSMPAVCESCPDRFHREYNYEVFEQVCDKFGVAII